MHLILIGMPGAGKSTLGLRLAQQLNLAFCDTDFEVEKRAGMPIAELVAAEGEAAFRTLEAEVLADALAEAPQIIATGGGAVMSEGAMDRLLAGGLVVYLEVEEATAVDRLTQSGRTQLLQGPVETAWPALAAERDDVYRKAHIICRDGELFAEALCALAWHAAGKVGAMPVKG